MNTIILLISKVLDKCAIQNRKYKNTIGKNQEIN